MLAARIHRSAAPFKTAIDEGTPVADLLTSLDIPLDDVALIVVNGRGGRPEQVLKAGDFLLVIPRVAGG